MNIAPIVALCLAAAIFASRCPVSSSTAGTQSGRSAAPNASTRRASTHKCSCRLGSSAAQVPVFINESYDVCSYLNRSYVECCVHLKFQDVSSDFRIICFGHFWKENLRTVIGIDLSNTQLQTFGILENVDFENLRALNLAGNRHLNLNSVAETNILASVTRLTLKGVQIEHFETLKMVLESSPNLQYLDISFCNIKDINLSYLATTNVNLSAIQLAGNPVKDITLNEYTVTQLQYLNASGCAIQVIRWAGETLPLESDVTLHTVDLSYNQLSHLPEFFARLMGGAKLLNFRGNRFDQKSCSYYHLWKLQFRNVRKVTRIETDFESDRGSQPSVLDCSWDQACPFECACDPLTKTVNCSGRGLADTPAIGPSDAEVLLLQDNALSAGSIRPLFEESCWCRLREINLDGNALQHLIKDDTQILAKCPCPQRVDLFGCLLPNARKLTFAHNLLSSVTGNEWKLVKMCHSLDLSHNHLNENSFDSLSRDFSTIRELNLSHNKFTVLTVAELFLFPFLTSLNVSHNSLEHIDLSLMYLAPKLKTLDLSYNKLRMIIPQRNSIKPRDPFGMPLPKLQRLFLHNNSLESLNPFIWRRLQQVTLGGNQWNCSKYAVANMLLFLWENLSPAVANEMRRLRCRSGSLFVDADVTELLSEKDIQVGRIEVNSMKESETKTQLKIMRNQFLVAIMCVTFFIPLMFLLFTPMWARLKHCCGALRPNHRTEPDEEEREYDVFVLYCDKDSEFARTEFIPKVTADFVFSFCHTDDFIYGSFCADEYAKYLSKSKRLVALISNDFFEDKTSVHRLKVALNEEKNINFKLAYFYLGKIPTPARLPRSIKKSLLCSNLRCTYEDPRWERCVQKFISRSMTMGKHLSTYSLWTVFEGNARGRTHSRGSGETEDRASNSNCDMAA